MGFVRKTVKKVGSLLSGGADEAAKQGAQIQAASSDKAIAAQERSLDKTLKFQREALDRTLGFQKESLETARSDLQPFRNVGTSQISPLRDDINSLSSLISDPNQQLDFIQKNPFFEALAGDAEQRLFANQAAKGKVGSGGTAKALQNSLLLLGQDLLNQNINQRSQNINQRTNLLTVGANAAAGQATASQNTAAGQSSALQGTAAGSAAAQQRFGSNISNLITGQGNALAAGEVGAANARAQGIENALKVGSSILTLSDRRLKRDIERIGTLDNGIPVYRYKFKGGDKINVGVMAQDVEKVNPKAVIEHKGIKFVDYSCL